MFESHVYIDLNRDDESFINRVKYKIERDIENDLYINSECYLGCDIEICNIQECTFIGKKDVYSFLSDGGICITYKLEYHVELYCYSNDDSDDDGYTFAGTVVVSIDRFIESSELENNPKYFNEDDEYYDFEIIENDIEQLD